jgi:hypothetical protein
VAQHDRYLVQTSFVRPDELDVLPERAWIGDIHWLALVCDGEELARRLKHRRKSRAIDDGELAGLLGINEEIRALAAADERVLLLDTSDMTAADVVEAAAGLIETRVD